MADTPKNDSVSTNEPCALYYFPEIPSGNEKKHTSAHRPDHFVSGTPKPSGDIASLHSGAHEQPDIQAVIEEAFNNGLEQGRLESVTALRENVESTVSAFNTAVSEMGCSHKQNTQLMETETVRLALAIARKIIGYEIEHAPVIRHVVKMAMEKIADPRQLMIRLHPGDIETVESIKPNLVLIDDGNMNVRIQPDDTIQQGGCIIETQLGDVDARIDQQIKMIEALLIDQLPKPADES
ncbi:FliH/SctL family protein [Desulfosarcina ovata]|uniref:FliH/SctL family protein n=1 Tax=Desulfosarcina ovata TaxID=83564 RepID=UPI001565F1C9|nr:FliH/SctL family protein [Desulfosarcina ovata]